MASRILLADDSITIQKVVNLTFADEGIEVVAVSNGDMAEKRLSEINPDLVLADIFMPGKNGYELCEHIKKNPQFADVPVVLLVGAFEPFDQAEARRVKADTHLTKPFESRVLVETVRRLISKGNKPATGSLGSAAPSAPAPPPPSELAPEEEGEGFNIIDTRSMASPLLNIDLKAMSGPSSHVDTGDLDPAVTSPTGFQSLSETSPLDLDYMSLLQDPPTKDAPSSAQFHYTDDPFRQTAQLGSFDAQEQADMLAAQQQYDSPVLVEDEPDVAPVEISPDEPFAGQASEDWSDTRSGAPSAFGYTPQAVILDFDQVPSPPTPEPENMVSLDVEISAQPAEDSAATTTAEPVDELDTGKLERPEPASVSAAESDETEPVEGVTIGPATSLLLSADNPFDVLFGDRSQPSGEMSVPEAALLPADVGQDWSSMSPLSPLGEFSTLEVAPESAPTPTVADEQEAEMSASQIVAEEDPALSAEMRVDVAEEAAIEWEPAAESSESGFESSSAQTTEAEYVAEEPARESLSSEMDDEKFSAAPMWGEPETHFTPIDIEAVAVSEPEAASPSPAEHQETGFDFQPVVEEPSAYEAPAETPPAAAIEPVAESTAVSSSAAAAELSSEMIDEIVRRVVAQISDKVVREIAWEVVPDAVERIIKELARDSLSKRS